MVDTDYETYAAYVECNGDFTRNFPVISSTTQDLPEEKVNLGSISPTFYEHLLRMQIPKAPKKQSS